jgi:sarcosine oxidase, subunit beta
VAVKALLKRTTGRAKNSSLRRNGLRRLMVEGNRGVEIAGAGSWGLSVAVALLEEGRKKVRVWEREQPGTGASGRAAGLLSTHLRQESDIRLVLETRLRILRLQEWGIKAGIPAARSVYHTHGNLTTVPEAASRKLRDLMTRIQRAGGSSTHLDSTAMKRHGWALAAVDRLEGVYSSDDGYVEPQDLVDLLRARVLALGGEVRTESPVQLRMDGSACVGLEAPSGSVDAAHVVVAGGAWTKGLLGRSGLSIPLKPYRTQIAQIQYPSAKVPVLHDTSLGFYARPDGPTRLLVGDGTEHVESKPEDYRTSVDASFIEKMAACVAERFQDGGSAAYRTGWAGLCVATPDRDPLIGPYPRVEGLTLMTGDNGFGVMRSLALGVKAAEAVLDPNARRTNPYHPGRLDFAKDFEIREGFEL